MSACPSLIYENISPERWTAIRAAVAKEIGITITTDAGSDTYDGFTIVWVLVSGDLTLTCTDSPWYVSCAMINGEIDGMIRPLLT